MNRIVKNRKCADKWINEWSLNCIRKFEDNMEITSQCTVYFSRDDGFKITHKGDKHTVFLGRRVCTCRAWDLNGTPCPHAICAMITSTIEKLT